MATELDAALMGPRDPCHPPDRRSMRGGVVLVPDGILKTGTGMPTGVRDLGSPPSCCGPMQSPRPGGRCSGRSSPGSSELARLCRLCSV